jgi:hypothetical protein
MVEGVNSSTIYLMYCKNFCKYHNVLPPGTTIQNSLFFMTSLHKYHIILFSEYICMTTCPFYSIYVSYPEPMLLALIPALESILHLLTILYVSPFLVCIICYLELKLFTYWSLKKRIIKQFVTIFLV